MSAARSAPNGTSSGTPSEGAPEPGRVAPRRFSRARIWFFHLVDRTCRLLGGRAWYRARYLAPGRLVARAVEVPLTGAPAWLDGYRLAVLSDFHGGSFVGPGDLAHAVALTARFDPDVVVVLGDFIVDEPEEVARVAPDLAALRARDGVFAVFGNHDYRRRREGELAAALPNLTFLRNTSARVRGAGAPDGGGDLVLVGVEDPEEGRVVDVAAARAAVRAGDVEVALVHHPRAAHTFAAPGPSGRGAHLVLAGHTHGVQVDLPVLRGLGPAHPGLVVSLGDTTLLVTRGLGVVGVPLRVGSPAEVLCVTLRRALRDG